MKTLRFTKWLAGFVCAFGTTLGAPVEVTTRSEIATANVRSTMNRDNGQITSSADITIKNIGDRPLEAPLHVAIFFTPESGLLDGMQVPGSLGGIGAPPYQTFFFDLSASIGAGLAPQASTTLPLRFTPPKGTRVTFRIVPHATVDADPVARAGGPYQARAGVEVVFDATSSSDPEGGALTFEWNFGDGSPTAPGAIARHSFSAPGLYETTLSVRDARNHLTIVRVPVAISPAADFAVARVRTLDGAGLPLGGVAIEERRNDQPRNLSSSSGGFAPLGSGIGSYTWKFSKPGYLPVWRQGQLLVNQAAIIANPWLPKENGQTSNLSPLNDSLLVSPSQDVRALFNAGAFPQGGQGAITDLSAQTLPFPLPLGWSPIAQFHLGVTEPPAEAGAATLTLPEALGSGQQAALVLYNAPAQRWEVRALVAGNGTTTVGAELLAAGSYALVLPDPAPFIPPSAEIGQPLTGATQAFEVGNVTATGSVTPDVSPASREAAAVTASARVVFSNPQPLPSGLFFPTRVTEKYALANERTARTPDYDTTVFAYHRPGSGLAAEFPMRPQLLFGPEELREATVKCDVLAPGAFKGGVIDQTGGVLGGDGIRVTVPAGAVDQAQSAELTPLDPQSFAAGLPTGVTAIKAFAINLAELAEGKALSIAIEGLEASALYVLGLAVSDGAGPGVTPLERFASDGTGRLSSAEPASGPRLPGARGPGDYVLLKINAPQALVQGVARDVAGNPAANLAIRSTGQPWLVFSGTDGSYKTLASSGAAVLSVVDPRDGNEGSASITITDPGQPQTLDLSAVPTGPRVVIVEPKVDPAEGSNKVRTATPIVARFSEPIVSASFGADGLTLTKAGGAGVEGSLSLNSARTEASFLPANPLEADTGYTIAVTDAIRDAQNLPITGNRIFTFKTTKPAARGEGAQLVIYEPGADNIPASILPLPGYSPAPGSSHVVAQGSAGTADPGVAVILVNQTTGETATVVSKADGSFANFINAAEEDFVTAVFVNANGTRVEIAATRQLFDDGRVGLYRTGGILEAESDGGPVQVLIKPGAIKERSKFKVESLGLAEILAAVNGTMPKDARLLSGVRVTVEGEVPNGEADVSFPLDASEMQFPPDESPEDAALALLIPQKIEGGGTAYQLVDKLRFEDGRAFSNTFPFLGFLASVALATGAETGLQALTLMALLGNKPVSVTGKVIERAEPSATGLVASIGEALVTTVTGIPGRPLRGAFVIADSLIVDNSRPGRIDPGVVYATSDENGEFALMLPVKIGEAIVPRSQAPGYRLVATHPRHARAAFAPIAFNAIGLGVIQKPIIEKDLVFDASTLAAGAGTSGARVEAVLNPLTPALNVAAQLRATAFSPAGTPEVEATIVTVASSVPGVTVTEDDVRITNPQRVNITTRTVQLTADVTATKALQALLRVTAKVTSPTGANIEKETFLVVQFGGASTVIPDDLPPADTQDTVGPGIISMTPTQGSALPVGGKIVLRFSEPVNRNTVLANGALVFVPNPTSKPGVSLSRDRQTLEITPGLFPSGTTDCTLTIGSAVRDLAGREFDQVPGLAGSQPFTFKFRPPPAVTTALSGIESGGGIVSHAGFAFALDRTGDGNLRVFNIDTVLSGQGAGPIASVLLPGFPRDLALIPDWSFKPTLDLPAVKKTLLAVVGGHVGTKLVDDDDNLFQHPQYLRVFDITDPAQPTRLLSAQLSLRNSVVNRVVWKPPFLTYVESGADLQQVGVIDLQEMILGFNGTPTQIATFPDEAFAGNDFGNDGSYTEAGDQLPLPARDPVEFFGKRVGFAITHPGVIQDVDFDSSGYVGVVMTEGRRENTVVNASYRTLQFKKDILPETVGIHFFDPGDRPKRVTALIDQPVLIQDQLTTRSLALVSLTKASGINQLVVFDISAPSVPSILEEIAIPSGLGIPQGVTRRQDGLLGLSTTTNLILFDPKRLTVFGPSNDSLHPSIVGIIPGAGSGNRTLDQRPTGLNFVSLGGRSEVVRTAPRLRFVVFPFEQTVVNPETLVPDPAAVAAKLAKMRELAGLPPARIKTEGGATSSVSPAAPAVHYHVLVDAPGGAGPSIRLSLEALNEAGYPLKNKGKGFPPVRAMSSDGVAALRQQPRSETDAPIRGLKAFRLSVDNKNPNYNLYLSEPFVVTQESVSIARLAVLQDEVPRAILWGSRFIRASIDPAEALNAVIGPFASTVDSVDRVARASAFTIGDTQNGAYLNGNNPPPIGGEVSLAGTFGTINASNGEFRHSTVDVSLPSPRMPIEFVRTIAGQDLHDGPFGAGWDFNYNQRLVQQDPRVVPQGATKPLLLRAQPTRSKIAKAKSVQFIDGQGHVVLFQPQEGTPPAFSQDPLVQQLGWLTTPGGTCYLPDANEKGVFDLLFQHVAGEFTRLTPGGQQYWYAADGRLQKIYDKYPVNLHVLAYNDRGELVRITDQSVTGDRFLDIGYYRLDGDEQSEFDESTASAFVAGRIARLKDYAERVTDFTYSLAGILEKRIGPQTQSGTNGFSGKPTTTYIYESPVSGGIKGIIAGTGSNAGANAGANLFTAQMQDQTGEKPVFQSGTGASGAVQGDVPPANSAADVDTTNPSSTTASSSKAAFRFDAFGYLRELLMTGVASAVASESNGQAQATTDYNDLGQLRKVTYPEGNSVEYEYDSSNVLVRARPNLLKITVSPGTRGGTPGTLERTFGGYDFLYNQPTTGKDFNGNSLAFDLRTDKRDIEKVNYPGSVAPSEMVRNEKGQLTKESNPNGIVIEYGYRNADGFLDQRIHGGLTTTYAYDSTAAALLGSPTGISPPRGAGMTLVYDSRQLRIKTTRGGMVEDRGYDENGNPTYLEKTVGGGAPPYIEERSYNQVNFLTRLIQKGIDLGNGAVDLETIYTPDAINRVKEILYPQTASGQARRVFEYDHRDNVVKSSLGNFSVEYARDRHGNVREIREGGVLSQVYAYDGYDRLVTETRQAEGGVERTERTYFERGEPKTIKVSKGADLVHDFVVDTIDAAGRPLVQRWIGVGASASQTIGYAAGNGLTTTVTGPVDTITTVADSAGRLRSRTDFVGTTNYTVDDNGNVEEINGSEDGNPYRAIFTFDDLDHVKSEADDEGSVWSSVLRLDGVATNVTDGRSNTTGRKHSQLGDLLELNRPENIAFRNKYDTNRQPVFEGDGTAGNRMAYTDGTLRLTGLTLRNQAAAFTFGDPDERNLPTAVQIPGGNQILAYDKLGRMLSESTSYSGGPFSIEDVEYDAKNRVRSISYGGTNADQTATYKYDPLGPLTEASFDEPGGPFTVAYGIRADGRRTSVTYPGDSALVEGRDTAGRLTALGSGDIFQIDSFAGRTEPKVIRYGSGTIQEENSYDKRRRLESRRYTRIADGQVLADMRYQYDGANNVTARQYLHRGGRTDIFEYDLADRLVKFGHGARPDFGPTAQTFADFPLGTTSLKPGLYAYTFSYDGGGLDLMRGGSLKNPNNLPLLGVTPNARRGYVATPFVADLSSEDSFLFPHTLDGLDRGSPDPLGNTSKTRLFVRPSGAPDPVIRETTEIRYNGRSNLVEVRRADGIRIAYEYQPGGLAHRKTVKDQNGSVLSDTAFVWDQGRLIQEHDLVASQLQARYYYDEGDAPVAADIRQPGGAFPRFYYLRDRDYSILGVTSDVGVVLERVVYGPWGQPVIEKRDTAAPQVLRIEIGASSNELLVVFTEPVLPPVSTPAADTLATSAAPITNAIEIFNGNNPVSGTVSYLEAGSNLPFGAVLKVVVGSPPSGTVSLRTQAGALRDEWGNGNAQQDLPITISGTPGTILFSAADPLLNTAAERVARSDVGNPFLFQGQYFDFDSGLLYLRKRFYDPFTGQFLQRDPLQFRDSVNLYAGFAHNPGTFRDPAGTNIITSGGRAAGNLLETVVEGGGARAAADAASEITAVVRHADISSAAAQGFIGPIHRGPFRTTVANLGREASLDEVRRDLTTAVGEALTIARAAKAAGPNPFLNAHPDAIILFGRAPRLMQQLLADFEVTSARNAVRVFPEAELVKATTGGVQKSAHGVSYIGLNRVATAHQRREFLIHEIRHSNFQVRSGINANDPVDAFVHETLAWRASIGFDLLRNARSPGNLTQEARAFALRGHEGLFEHFATTPSYYKHLGITREVIARERSDVLNLVTRLLEQGP